MIPVNSAPASASFSNVPSRPKAVSGMVSSDHFLIPGPGHAHTPEPLLTGWTSSLPNEPRAARCGPVPSCSSNLMPGLYCNLAQGPEVSADASCIAAA